VAIFFALSLPGLVIVIIGLGVIQLLRSKKSGNRRPGSASAGMNLLDLVLKPGSEHRLIEQEEQKMKVQPSEDGAPPFSKFRINGKEINWVEPKED
jgi:hypothetical protein